MSNPRLAFALVAVMSLAAAASRADDLTTAQQLFRQGRALMSEGKVAEACAKFEGASELSQTAGVRLNLAECWAKLGRTASAWAKYEEAETLADRAGDAVAAELARTRRAALEPQLCYLTIVVPPESVVEGLELMRDGRKLPNAAWDTPVPVDPGNHEVVASAPGRESWSTKRDVKGAGATVTLSVPLLAVGDAQQPGRADRKSAGDSGFGTQRTLAVVSGGIGVVGLGIGTYFGKRAKSKRDDYELHRSADGRCLDLQCQTSSEDARAAGNWATVGFAAGAALVTTGVVLWLSAPTGESTASAVLAPVAGAQVAGVEMRGSW